MFWFPQSRTFQVVIAGHAAATYSIFLYQNIETTIVTGGSFHVGYSLSGRKNEVLTIDPFLGKHQNIMTMLQIFLLSKKYVNQALTYHLSMIELKFGPDSPFFQ